MTEPPRDALADECRVLSLHLCGVEPAEYVVRKYRQAHETGAVAPVGTAGRFDRLLVALAARGPLGARVADAYASFFRRSGLLRRKLVLVLAILESTAEGTESVDTVTPGSRLGLVARIAAMGALTVLTAVLAGLVLGPLQLILGNRSSGE